jgi:hypothetical protein
MADAHEDERKKRDGIAAAGADYTVPRNVVRDARATFFLRVARRNWHAFWKPLVA